MSIAECNNTENEILVKPMHGLCVIIGHRKGGNVALLYDSMYHDVPKIVNVSGLVDLRRGIEDNLGKDFVRRIRNAGIIDVKDKKGKVMYCVSEKSIMDRPSTDNMRAARLSIHQNGRVLTIHGSEDEIVPTENAFEFSKYITNHKLHIIERSLPELPVPSISVS